MVEHYFFSQSLQYLTFFTEKNVSEALNHTEPGRGEERKLRDLETLLQNLVHFSTFAMATMQLMNPWKPLGELYFESGFKC